MAKKSKKVSLTYDQIKEASHLDEFIPYACHYDPHTILTKNGELMQVIKITGFNFESVEGSEAENVEKITVRRAIRKAVKASIKSDKFALWIHTVRRKEDLSSGGVYPEGFAHELNEGWCDRNEWRDKYINELYISVLVEGEPIRLFDPALFMRSLWFPGEVYSRRKYFTKSYGLLDETVQAMVENLQSYGARRIGLVKNEQSIYYSEIQKFLGKIINLDERDIPVEIADLSTLLAPATSSFGFNDFTVTGPLGTKHGTVMTIKEYRELPADSLDKFTQLHQEFIITETFDFIAHKEVRKHFERQHKILQISEDSFLEEVSGISEIMSEDENSLTAYGKHQISVTLFEDSSEALEASVKTMLGVLSELGVLVIREDIFIEDSYWAQLPGNFEFLKRLHPVNTASIGGYSSLYNFPAGKLKDNHWGDAVTVFYTAAGTPYFFNFHYGDSGHTFIIGPHGAGKTVLLNFLISQTRKFNNRLFFFDHERGSEIFLRAIGGKYNRVLRNAEQTLIRFNPLLLPNTEENHDFLYNWFEYLITAVFPGEKVDETRLEQVVDFNFSLAPEERRLSNIIPRFWPASESELGDRMKIWYGDGKYAHIFDNPADMFDPNDGSVHGFGLTHLVEDKTPLIPTIYYLLHRIYYALDGSPTIIVLDEAWKLVDNPVFAPYLGDWLDSLRAHNAIVIFATESVDYAHESSITRTLADKVETQIFLPNPEPSKAYMEVFGMSKREFAALSYMEAEYREFLLKHHIDAVIAELNLDGMDFELSVLSATKEKISAMESAILEAGEAPEQWLPVFRRKLESGN